jgi:hypothetical protein
LESGTPGPLLGWESFYVIIGSSAAALTGLQFVVIVLGAERDAVSSAAMRAFGSPTILHFCAVLLVSAIASAPWPAISGAGLALGLCGVAGVVFMGRAFGHARRQTDYAPVFEDWLFHFALPAVGYAALAVPSIFVVSHPRPALFVIGGAAVLLLLVGIHNAWDSVTYIATRERPRQNRRGGRK